MNGRVFITGTDTGIGKTYISVGLLKALNQAGFTTLGIKPVASGCEIAAGQLVNADAVALQQVSSIKLPYAQINPCHFVPAIAPHIAAAKANVDLSVKYIIKQLQPALNSSAEIKIIEGVGGWSVPLNEQETMADLVDRLNVPVILVVGIKLGCLNHALLTVAAIKRSAVNLMGWVANIVDPEMENVSENIEMLKSKIQAPYLGVVGYGSKPEKVIDVKLLYF